MPAEFDFAHYSDDDLLRMWKRLVVVLRQRGICRTKNIASDVAERVVSQRLGLTRARSSMRCYDATGPDGTTYQIKCRDLSSWNDSRQLGDIHHLEEPRPFDFLIAVFFGADFPLVETAYKIPLPVVRQFVRKKGKRDVLIAQGQVLTAPGVEDITAKLQP